MTIAEKLGILLRFPTVAGTADVQEDPAAFEGCREAVHRLYPQVAAACERHLVAGRGLVYRWKGKAKDAPWVLMAHYDVVPAPDEGWDRPPFSGEISDGLVHGRGAVDTKSTLAAMLEAAEGLIGEGFVPEQDIYFCFSADEETYGPTTGEIIRWLQGRDALPYAVLDEGGQVEEDAAPGFKGTAVMVGVAEKGMAQLRLSVTGPGGHASCPPGESQAFVLAKALARLHRKPFPMRITSPVMEGLRAFSAKSSLPYLASRTFGRLSSAQSGPGDRGAVHTTCAHPAVRKRGGQRAACDGRRGAQPAPSARGQPGTGGKPCAKGRERRAGKGGAGHGQ